MHEVLLHQVFCFVFFYFPPEAGEGVDLDKPNSAFGKVITVSMKVQGCFVLLLFVNGKKIIENYFWAALKRDN